jgi:hypothetical protein
MRTARNTRIGIAAYLCLALIASASAQEMETRVIVPESPGGANFAGCYRADRDLYGPHRLTMCFERRGTYTIRGGARCDGDLSWRVSGRDIFIDLRRASCRWRVLTSNLPRLRALDCTYRPTVRGERNERFRATRR